MLSSSPHSCPQQPGANLLQSKGVTANPNTPLAATTASPSSRQPCSSSEHTCHL